MKKYRQRESEVGLVGSTERLELYGDVEKLGEYRRNGRSWQMERVCSIFYLFVRNYSPRNIWWLRPKASFIVYR